MTNITDIREMKARIIVFGVGGAGGNAVNNMIKQNLEGVDFIVANTDAQALAQSLCQRRPLVRLPSASGCRARFRMMAKPWCASISLKYGIRPGHPLVARQAPSPYSSH